MAVSPGREAWEGSPPWQASGQSKQSIQSGQKVRCLVVREDPPEV